MFDKVFYYNLSTLAHFFPQNFDNNLFKKEDNEDEQSGKE